MENPDYTVVSQGVEEDSDIRIAVKIDGKEFTQEQWDAFEAPQVRLVQDDRDFKIDLEALDKTEGIGVLRTRPVFPGGRPSTGTYRNVDYEVSYEQQLGSETWRGGMKGTVNLKDSRSWWERNWVLFV